MAEITIVKPHDEGKSALEVTVNGEKWSITRGETVDVPEYIATEVRRSIAQRDSLSLADRDEREGEPESGGSGGGGGESSNVETATIEITVTDGTPTITSGEFPEWLTPSNSDCIYGKVEIENATISAEDSVIAEEVSGSWHVYEIIDFSFPGSTGSPYLIDSIGENTWFWHVSTDLLMIGDDDGKMTSGMLYITLIYMPN